MRDFNALAADIHRRNHKWWHTEDGVRLEREAGELFMLAVSEVAEGMEGVRKSKPGAPLMDDKLPHREMIEVELADTVIRLLDSSVGMNIGIDTSLIELRDPVETNRAAALLGIVAFIVDLNECFAIGGQSPLDGRQEDARNAISMAIGICYDYAAQYGHDLDGAIDEKLAYNDNRADHSYEARKAAGGKAF
jgi:hypothetical protein